MIRAVTGLPGEGKTCYAVQHIILAELMVGDRYIYSNIEWHVPELIQYCQQWGYTIDPTRLHLLKEDQIPYFWRHVSDGSMIVLDEVAEHFNSQSWKEIGTEAGTWARQHRKLGHEAYLVVQDLSHIFKQFRDLIAEEIKITNLSNRKLLGISLPKFFLMRKVHRDSKSVSTSKIYKFNTDVFKTYNTLATIGGVLERGEVKKGKKSEQVKKRRNILGWIGSHWMGLTVCTIMIMFFLPFFFLQSCILNKTENIEKDESKKEIISLPDDPIGTSSITSKRERTNSADLGRYDSTDKRSP